MENHERAVEIHAFRVVSEESKEPLLHLNGSFGQVNSKRLLGGQDIGSTVIEFFKV